MPSIDEVYDIFTRRYVNRYPNSMRHNKTNFLTMLRLWNSCSKSNVFPLDCLHRHGYYGDRATKALNYMLNLGLINEDKWFFPLVKSARFMFYKPRTGFALFLLMFSNAFIIDQDSIIPDPNYFVAMVDAFIDIMGDIYIEMFDVLPKLGAYTHSGVEVDFDYYMYGMECGSNVPEFLIGCGTRVGYAELQSLRAIETNPHIVVDDYRWFLRMKYPTIGFIRIGLYNSLAAMMQLKTDEFAARMNSPLAPPRMRRPTAASWIDEEARQFLDSVLSGQFIGQ